MLALSLNGWFGTTPAKPVIAANLARQEPSRKDDIYRAFELWMEPV